VVLEAVAVDHHHKIQQQVWRPWRQ